MDTSLIARGRYQVTFADLDMWIGTCPECGGPSPRLHVAVDPLRLGSGNTPAANYEGIGGLKRYFRANECSGCELKAIIARIFPPPPAPIEAPADQELRRLRAELTARDAPAAAVIAAPRGLFDPGTVLVTPAAGEAVYRCSTNRAGASIGADPWAAHVRPLLSRHVAGDFGLVGQVGDGNIDTGSGMNPLASPVDRNRASIAEKWGSVRSLYRVERTERRRNHPLSDWTEFLAERNEIAVRTELAIAKTLVALASEVQGQT